MRLLLHICCGPCALYPLKKLLSEKFSEVTGFFYNPNIHPPSEYKHRKETLDKVANGLNLKIIYPPYNMEEYFRKIYLKEISPDRCPLCWELRLSKTADFAKINGYDSWTTTLLISPYQDHKILKELGTNIGREKSVEFYYEDFRDGFRESQASAKEHKLYRQRYCGCVFSERY